MPLAAFCCRRRRPSAGWLYLFIVCLAALPLRVCRVVQDGAAYLLERRGDVQSALKIYIQNLDRGNRSLVAAVQSGTLDLAGAALAAEAATATVGVGSSGGSGGAAGHASLLLRQRRPAPPRAASAAAAAAACAALLQVPPAQVREALVALRSAVAMCLR